MDRGETGMPLEIFGCRGSLQVKDALEWFASYLARFQFMS
jgi:hypothetical protein